MDLDEYTVDAIATLSARAECVTVDDRTWVIEYSLRSLDEID